ncbi:MAG TPA: hypothetical protein VNO50_13935 [Pyrinomonadaceae bacterium]|nr:hypothetical protein [Pyrinomonadaceae bacterium]
MRSLHITRHIIGAVILCTVVCALAAQPIRSRAQPATSVNIVNNSNRVISHVYLSHVSVDNWGADQLGETPVAPGQSVTLSNFACDQSQIKVIAEDQDGCFLATVIDCGSNAAWTITSSTAADCGN